MPKLSLIRTEGKEFLGGGTLSPARFVVLPPLLRASKSAATIDAENEFGLGDCLYFYGGHACPDFGDVVLLYFSDMADTDSGSATPFDTGGLRNGRVHLQNLMGQNDVKDYCVLHEHPLTTWRGEADRYLADHFASAEAYVTGQRPIRDDDSGRLLHAQNSRRAWTWEIRVHRDQVLTNRLQRIWMSADYFEAVRQALLLAPSNSFQACRALFNQGTVKSSPIAGSPHRDAENEAVGWI